MAFLGLVVTLWGMDEVNTQTGPFLCCGIKLILACEKTSSTRIKAPNQQFHTEVSSA